ncbi:lipopolysaccharide-induced tumor necrosis factor-alpha factor homolog isoform X4 [Boleophthalmus pectinirostris]|uniref:lipopolysaccharide-induced tumor necrosis factor-alpha factor homolog isoform X4 n=1 Tax=Boleophthalmus pectinirostris TaxID=150288 RepID=UPI00242F5CB5|nr:lipopolysaccharide-induced tumor necrosis factor-alpha factor homolog isoform X4 [Boleophthalmus pectinirostris]
MEKGYVPTESAPPYPGPPMNYHHGQTVMHQPPHGAYYGGPSYPSAPVLPPSETVMNDPAPPYPGPPVHYPGVQSAGLSNPQVGHQGGVFHAPVTVLRGPPFTSPPSNTAWYTPVGVFAQDVPRAANCPHCHQAMVTQIEHAVGARTWLMCLFMLWPCCCVPFFVDSCKDVKHRCPSCQKIMYF